MKFNEQVTRIEPSPLRAFNDMAHKEGAELFLTLGEPDFHTPQQVKDACGVALENNKTFYAPLWAWRSFAGKFPLSKNNSTEWITTKTKL